MRGGHSGTGVVHPSAAGEVVESKGRRGSSFGGVFDDFIVYLDVAVGGRKISSVRAGYLERGAARPDGTGEFHPGVGFRNIVGGVEERGLKSVARLAVVAESAVGESICDVVELAGGSFLICVSGKGRDGGRAVHYVCDGEVGESGRVSAGGSESGFVSEIAVVLSVADGSGNCAGGGSAGYRGAVLGARGGIGKKGAVCSIRADIGPGSGIAKRRVGRAIGTGRSCKLKLNFRAGWVIFVPGQGGNDIAGHGGIIGGRSEGLGWVIYFSEADFIESERGSGCCGFRKSRLILDPLVARGNAG